eukprot:1130654-Pelagomonas_calceolata.AAC.2
MLLTPCELADRFPSLSHLLPSPEELPWGVSALATSFETARDLFNAAIPRFNASLEYYKLDGWVTEHVTTQLESNPIHFSSGRQVLEEDEALLGQKRVLAAFEQDPKRRAAMHKLRVSRLAHLVGALNPQVPTAGCLDHAHQAALTVHNRLPRMCAVAALIAHRRLP